MLNRDSVYNFGAGPACLPKSVLDKIKSDLPDWYQGMSVMEVSHRSKAFMDLLARVEASLRSLLKIPEHFSVHLQNKLC